MTNPMTNPGGNGPAQDADERTLFELVRAHGATDPAALSGLAADDSLSCTAYREEIPLFVGGDLEPQLMDALAAHLAVCPPCAEATASFSRTRNALHAGLDAGASEWREPSLWPAVAAAIGADRVEVVQPAPRGRLLSFSSGTLRRVAALAAAVLLAVVLGPRLFGPGSVELIPSGDGPGDALVLVEADPVLDDYGTGLIPVAYREFFEQELDLPTEGPRIPLTAREMDLLRDSAPLQWEPEEAGRTLRIQSPSGSTLATWGSESQDAR